MPETFLKNAKLHTILTCIGLLFSLTASGSEEWITGKLGNITYISNESERKTQKIAKEVTLFEQGLIKYVESVTDQKNWPLRIIVCKDAESFAKLAPSGQKYKNSVSGVFTSGLAYDLILIRSDANSSQMRSVVYHEMTHRLLRDETPLPLWLDEGYAEFYSGFQLKKDRIRFGIRDVAHCRWINKRGMIPLARLFNVSHESREYNDTKQSHAFYATSWALTHYCLLHKNPQIREAFVALRHQSIHGLVNEKFFIDNFGFDYKTMESKLEKYSRQFRHGYLEEKLDGRLLTDEIKFESLSNKQRNAYFAGALTLSNRPEEAAILLSQNLEILDSKKHTTTSDLVDSIQLNYMTGNYQLARQLAKKAYDHGIRNPGALLIYAEELLDTTPGQRISYFQQIPNQQLNLAMRCINQVLELDANRAHAWNLYALAWLRTDTQPEYKHIQKLLKSNKLLPRNKNLCFLTVELLIRSDRKPQAIQLLRSFIDTTNNPSEKREAREIVSRIS